MKIMEIDTEIKAVSQQRQKSLILRIPANIRDIMQLKHGTKTKIEVHVENDEKYLKLYMQD